MKLSNGGITMKKHTIILIPAITMAIGLTACSTNSQSEKNTKAASAATQADLKRPLVRYFMDLSKKINAKDMDLNVYESKDQPTPEMKVKASESAAEVANQLRKIQIPSELKGQKVQLEAALKDIADSYTAKAEELKQAAPSFDQADSLFTKGEDELGMVYENNHLLKPSLNKEVN
jgi:maltose-binding protein MalE